MIGDAESIRAVKSKKYLDIVLFCILFVFIVQIIILIADFVYFPEAKRHIADELSNIWSDRMYIVSYIVDTMLLGAILFFISFVFLCFYTIKLFNKKVNYKKISLTKNIVVILISL